MTPVFWQIVRMTDPIEPPALNRTQILANLAADRAIARLKQMAAEGIVIADEADFVDREITSVLREDARRQSEQARAQ